MKRLLVLLLITCSSLPVMARDVNTRTPLNNNQIRLTMNNLINALTEKDTPKHGDKEFDNDLNMDQAVIIKQNLTAIKQLIPASYNANFKNLEENTNKLIEALKTNDAKSSQYSQAVFDSCFNCHLTHRN